MGESLSEYLISQRFSEFFLSVKIQNTSVFQPVYHGLLTNGPLSVCAFLCTLLVQFPPNSFLSLYFIHVTLLLCCTFFVLCSFHDSLFPMYSCKLHSFGVEIFPVAFFIVPFSSCCTFLCCAFSVSHYFYFWLFYSLLVISLCCTFFICHFFMLQPFCFALSSYYILFVLLFFRVELFSYFAISMLHFFRIALFSCCTFS